MATWSYFRDELRIGPELKQYLDAEIARGTIPAGSTINLGGRIVEHEPGYVLYLPNYDLVITGQRYDCRGGWIDTSGLVGTDGLPGAGGTSARINTSVSPPEVEVEATPGATGSPGSPGGNGTTIVLICRELVAAQIRSNGGSAGRGGMGGEGGNGAWGCLRNHGPDAPEPICEFASAARGGDGGPGGAGGSGGRVLVGRLSGPPPLVEVSGGSGGMAGEGGRGGREPSVRSPGDRAPSGARGTDGPPGTIGVVEYLQYTETPTGWPPQCNFDVYNAPDPVLAADPPNNDLATRQVSLENRDASTVFHVVPPQSDTDDPMSGTGTQADPFKSIARAMTALAISPNVEVVYLHLGPDPTRTVFKEPVAENPDNSRERVATKRAGTAQTPLWLYADRGMKMAADGSSRDVPFITIKHDYWIVEGIEIDGTGARGAAISVSNIRWPDGAALPEFTPVNHVLVRGLHAHSGQAREAVEFVGARDVTLIDSEIHGYWPISTASNADSHAILVYYSSERVWIENNTAYDNDGDGVQCLGPLDDDSAVPANSVPAEHVTIVGNHFYRNIENAVDVKSCTTVTVRGNRFHDYRSAGSRSGKGTAIVIHYNADRVLVEDNDISRSGQAAGVGNPEFGQVGAVVFRRNFIHDMTVLTDTFGDIGDTSSGLQLSTARRIEVYHNTFLKLPRGRDREDPESKSTSGYAVRLDINGGPVDQATFVNNIVADVELALIKEHPSDVLSCDRNLYFYPAGTANRPVFRIRFDDKSWTEWRDAGYDCTSPEPAEPLLTTTEDGKPRIDAASPARDRGAFVVVNGVVEDFEGARPDIGALEFSASTRSLRTGLSQPGRRIAAIATTATAVIAVAIAVSSYFKRR